MCLVIESNVFLSNDLEFKKSDITLLGRRVLKVKKENWRLNIRPYFEYFLILKNIIEKTLEICHSV
jgi:hypothetical protein